MSGLNLMGTDNQMCKKISVEVLHKYKQIITTYITAQQEARREKILFLLSLNDVWKKMPPELSVDEKKELLLSVIDRYFKESNSSSEILALSIKDMLSGEILEYKKNSEELEEKIQNMQHDFNETAYNYEGRIKSAEEQISLLQQNNDELKDKHAEMIAHIIEGLENTPFLSSYKYVLETFLGKYNK